MGPGDRAVGLPRRQVNGHRTAANDRPKVFDRKVMHGDIAGVGYREDVSDRVACVHLAAGGNDVIMEGAGLGQGNFRVRRN